MKSLSLLQRVGLILLPLLLVGCFGPRKDNVRHFALQVPAGESAARRHPGTLMVGDLDVSRVHDRRAMLVRRSAVEVHYERERRWADRPHVMLSDAIAGHLGAAGLFATVVRSLGDRPPTWVLGGRVDAFEVVAGKKGWQVRLTMRLDLRRFETDDVLWRHLYMGQKSVPANDHAAAARGLSELLGQAMGKVDKGLTAAKLTAGKTAKP